MMEQHERGSWGTNFGFLMAAVGSAVGLGNIWGFPYKMGRYGGFAFLIVYLLLVIFVGAVVMLGELTIGRKTGLGAVGAYGAFNKKHKWVGYIGVASAFFLLTFYNVLGG
ncbi:MAG TPA: sodium-dependent transporter, partial [Candidatus Scatomorpha merdipullorum]|nr:sodium-dependent transporter [Candidatus Scatomorpha merdipullorum]